MRPNVSNRDSERTRVTRVTDVADTKPGVPGGASVIVIYGVDLGKRVPIGSAQFSIGRSAQSDLSIDQESVSRNHARITFDGSDYWIQDLGSTNGTYVNDQPVLQRRLLDGDQVRIGRSILKFMTGANLEVQYHEEIYRLMTIDGLTQIFNRRYFDEALEREFNRSRRYQRQLCLIIFDIDFFKRVNDTYGHLAGDHLLRHTASLVKPRLRREDTFARTGGEEFAVLLPEIPLDGARTTAEKIRRIVETAQLQYEQHAISCTISLGVAEVTGSETAADDLYRAADERLYQAKQGGRNQVA
jgi:diguanylate cyclase (GGDEF)-like protein